MRRATEVVFDVGALDVREHRHQRHLELAIDPLEVVRDEQRRQTVRELPRQVSAFQ